MIREAEEELLWDSVTLLHEQNRSENAKVVFKSIVEKPFALLRQPMDFMDALTINLPSPEVTASLRRIDRQIRRSLSEQNVEQAYMELLEYIGVLVELVPDADQAELQKRIIAKFLANQFGDKEATNHLGVIKLESYTSSEAAKILDVSDQTIRRWCERGKYPNAYQTEGGHWRIPRTYFRITLEQAEQREEFEQELNRLNARKGEADESEFL